MEEDFQIEPLAESENFMVYTTTDEEGETVYHIEIYNITLHLNEEEWAEFAELIGSIKE
jgi:hypothetical protein